MFLSYRFMQCHFKHAIQLKADLETDFLFPSVLAKFGAAIDQKDNLECHYNVTLDARRQTKE